MQFFFSREKIDKIDGQRGRKEFDQPESKELDERNAREKRVKIEKPWLGRGSGKYLLFRLFNTSVLSNSNPLSPANCLPLDTPFLAVAINDHVKEVGTCRCYISIVKLQF